MRRFDPRSVATAGVPLVGWYKPGQRNTLTGTRIETLACLNGTGPTLARQGTPNLVSSDANLKGQPSCDGSAGFLKAATTALPSAGATRTTIFVGYPTDTTGGTIATFGTTTKYVVYWLNGGPCYVGSDGVAATVHYATPDLVANQAVCLRHQMNPGVGMTFSRSGAAKTLSGSTLVADVGAYFDISWAARWAEFLCYDGLLSDQAYTDLVGAYLAPLYGVAG